VTCNIRCPLNGRICEDCMNNESEPDGPDPAMYEGDGHPREDDWEFGVQPHGAGSWGI